MALRSEGGVRLTLTGGTFNTSAPSFPFLEITWRAYLAAIGMPVSLACPPPATIPRAAGSSKPGSSRPRPGPWSSEVAASWSRSGGWPRRPTSTPGSPGGWSTGPSSGWPSGGSPPRSRRAPVPGPGPGASIALVAEYADAPPATFVGLGKKGKPAEAVADEAVDELLENIEATEGAVDLHSADQILLPLAFAEGRSVYTVTHVTEHLRTNARTIRAFLDRPIRVEESDEGPGGRVIVG